MIADTRYVVRQKMKQRIAELSKIYPYAREKKENYCLQMLISSYSPVSNRI